MKVKLQNYVSALLGRKVDILNIRNESYVKNQGDKEVYILPYVSKAFQLNKSRNVTFLEFFCADGYYSFWVKKFLNPSISIGIDLDKADIKRCLLMKKNLGVSGMEFVQKDVYELDDSEQFDIVLNAGRLYHVTQPEKLLKLCFKITRRYMILQTVTTLETESEDYFVSPAPGWRHGCRFTDAWLVRRLIDTGDGIY